jgi:hypothetical protein
LRDVIFRVRWLLFCGYLSPLLPTVTSTFLDSLCVPLLQIITLFHLSGQYLSSLHWPFADTHALCLTPVPQVSLGMAVSSNTFLS